MTEAEELELLELEELEAKEKSGKPGVSGGTAFLRGAGQGATLGYADELAGLTAAIREAQPQGPEAVKAVISMADPRILIEAIKNTAEGSETYTKPRDEGRKADKEASTEHPMLYGAGNLAGAGATMLIPGMAPATVAKMAALGGIAGLGGSDADLSKGEVGEAALDTGQGAAFGAIVGKAGEMIPGAAKGLKEGATRIARRALGYRGAALSKKGAIDRANEVARTMLDEKGIPWIGNGEKILEAIEGIKSRAGEGIGALRTRLDEAGVGALESKKIINRILKELMPEQGGGVYDDIVQHVGKTAETVSAHGKEIPFGQAEKLKTLLREAAGNTDNVKRDVYRGASRIVREETEGSLDKTAKMMEHLNPKGNAGLYDKYLNDKRLYGAASEAEGAALKKVGAEAGNVLPGVRGSVMAGARLAAGDIPGAVGAAGGMEAMTRYGAAFAANATDTLSKILAKSPQVFGKFASTLTAAAANGPEALSVSHYLLNQQDPEYQDAFRKAQEEIDKE